MKYGSQILLTLVSFFSGFLHAQIAPSIEWQKCLGGSGNDVGYSIQQTTDGGFIVAGWSFSNDGDVSGNHGGILYGDYWIVKLDISGNIIWQKTFGGTYDEEAISVKQTTDGGFIINGSTISQDGDISEHFGFYDWWVIRLDTVGNLIWQKSLGGISYDGGGSIQQTTDGGFICTGNTSSTDVAGHHGGLTVIDYFIVKLDSGGNIMWQKCLGGQANDGASSVLETMDGGFIVAGFSSSNDGDVSGNHGGEDSWIVKLDSIGNIVWQKCLGGSGTDGGGSIQQSTDGGFIVAGWTFSNDGDVSGNHDLYDDWIVKLDEDGNLVWQKCLGGSGNDGGRSIQQTTDGGFIVAGYSNSNDGDVSGNHGFYDYWVVKLNASGNLVWQKSLGGSSDEVAYSIQQTFEGGFIVAGYSSSNDGDVSGNHGSQDYWIVKLSKDTTTGIASVSKQLISLFPNPVQSQLNINLAMPAYEVTVHVYDVQGKIMSIPTSNFQSQTSNFLQLNTENLPSGFYTLQVINNKTGKSEMGKFVKQE